MKGSTTNGCSSVYHSPASEPPSVPRLFKVSYWDDDEDVEVVECYGVAFPEGGAGTMSPGPGSFGRWISAESAERRLCGDLTWLS